MTYRRFYIWFAVFMTAVFASLWVFSHPHYYRFWVGSRSFNRSIIVETFDGSWRLSLGTIRRVPSPGFGSEKLPGPLFGDLGEARPLGDFGLWDNNLNTEPVMFIESPFWLTYLILLGFGWAMLLWAERRQRIALAGLPSEEEMS